MNVLQRIGRNFVQGILPAAPSELRYGFQDWVDSFFTFNGTQYALSPSTTMTGREETVGAGFAGLVQYAYKSNGVVFAAELARIMLFSQARFMFQNFRSGRPGDMYSNPSLGILEHPWPGGTTQDLLAGMIQDADFAGNAFVWRTGGKLNRLRPDWTVIIAGSRNDPDVTAWDPGSEVLAYLHYPGGRGSGRDPIVIPADQVAHFAPIPDPLSPWRGMSWLDPILTDIKGDQAANRHKLAFYENGATVNLAIVMDPTIQLDAFNKWIEIFEKEHKGSANAFKTLYLGGGADPKVIGSDLKQADFAVTQAAGENRIAMASGVPAIIMGSKEGLDSATYSNYGQARRAFGDRMHWLWQNVAGSLERIIPSPQSNSRLVCDTRDIPFLRDDAKDAAEVFQIKAATVRTLIEGGMKPETAVKAVDAEDLSVLEWTGLVSVQLQPPGTTPPATIDKAVTDLVKQQNGNGKVPA